MNNELEIAFGAYVTKSEDVFLYSGPIDVSINSLREIIDRKVGRKKNVVLFLTTYGGDPDWAYRLVAILRNHYNKFTLVIPGPCKSAGTLVAIGADELRFHQFGELGPLDVQMQRKDNLLVSNSGLDVFDAIKIINTSVRNCFHDMFLDFLIQGSGSISTETAAKVATEVSVGIYSAIASKIEPLELGEKNRAIKIANAYGDILNGISLSKNVLENTVSTLISAYPSHGFVIDRKQAEKLFRYVNCMLSEDYVVYRQFATYLSQPQQKSPFISDLDFLKGRDRDNENAGNEKTNKPECSEIPRMDIKKPSVESRGRSNARKKRN